MKKSFLTFELGERKLTLAIVKPKEQDTLRIGYAVCMVGDAFNEDLGRAIAIGRALSKSSISGYCFGNGVARELATNRGVQQAILHMWKHKIIAEPSLYIKGLTPKKKKDE